MFPVDRETFPAFGSECANQLKKHKLSLHFIPPVDGALSFETIFGRSLIGDRKKMLKVRQLFKKHVDEQIKVRLYVFCQKKKNVCAALHINNKKYMKLALQVVIFLFFVATMR